MQEMQELQNLHNQQQQADHILVMSGHLDAALKTEADLIADSVDQRAQHIVVQMEHSKAEPVKSESSTWLKACASRSAGKKNWTREWV